MDHKQEVLSLEASKNNYATVSRPRVIAHLDFLRVLCASVVNIYLAKNIHHEDTEDTEIL